MSTTPIITVNTPLKLQLPTLPNYIRNIDGIAVPISALSPETLREIGKLWGEALVAKAAAKGGK